VVCVIKNTATLPGSLFTLHCSQIHIDLPTLSDDEKDVWKLSLPFSFSLQNVTFSNTDIGSFGQNLVVRFMFVAALSILTHPNITSTSTSFSGYQKVGCSKQD
jgi:hypothetical protein